MKPLDPKKLRTVRAKGRPSLVKSDAFAEPVPARASFRSFYASLADILKAADLRRLAAEVIRSHRRGKGVFWALGGHVIKTGCAPILIDLMERGLVDALVLNGSAAIHDFEIAFMGKTSEDVAAGVDDGSFGMAEETGAFFADAAERGREIGLGTALKELVAAGKGPHRERSLLAAAARCDVPLTVHVGIGTDIVHMHPRCDGAALGAASHYDFRLLGALCSRLHRGCFLNWGSAVILPEVFVKAVTMQNNVRKTPLRIVTANFDQLRHYRPRVNVLERPAVRGFDFAGHHELMLPLFRMALLTEMES